MISAYGSPPAPEPLDPILPYNPLPQWIPATTTGPLLPPAASPRGPGVEHHLMTPETLAEVEHYCAAMIRYLSLPREQRAAVDRYVDAARKLVGTVDLEPRMYEIARKFAGSQRKDNPEVSK